jgi:hypothetical protein
MNLYLAKVKINTSEGSKPKFTTLQYLISAVSVTDAEVLVYKEFEGETLEWELISVTKSPILKVINYTAE